MSHLQPNAHHGISAYVRDIFNEQTAPDPISSNLTLVTAFYRILDRPRKPDDVWSHLQRIYNQEVKMSDNERKVAVPLPLLEEVVKALFDYASLRELDSFGRASHFRAVGDELFRLIEQRRKEAAE